MATDSNMILRSDATDLTGSTDGALTGVDFGAPDNAPITYEVIVPSKSGTSPTLDVQIEESNDDSTYTTFLIMPQITAAGTYFITGRSDMRYRRVNCTVGGTNTPNFSKTLIRAVPAGRSASF